ncbi:ATP-binding protein [uncultured Desulfosarcina sp.]|uniref:hybrid sensor histidine kinase/response regulator n=1 Tax=uncultured Desulfosarcina sp. TaxID=218289 RepID=UPI0029C9691B|nr:ATP-binding protein [uncultured Desulfosarcina sp.]
MGKTLKTISFKTKMILGGIAAVIVPFLIAGVVIYIQISRPLIEMSKEMAVHRAEDIAATIDDRLRQEIVLASAIAAKPIIVEAAITGDYQAAQKSLDAIHKRIGNKYFTIFLLDRHGIARADAVFHQQIGLDLSTRDYFLKAKEGQASVAGPLHARGNATLGAPIIVVAVPILRDKEFLGVVGFPFEAEFIIQLASKASSANKGYSYIIDDEGLILFHPRKEFILKKRLFDQPGTEAVRQVLMGGKVGTASYLFEGTERIAGFYPVDLTGWIAVFCQDRAAIMAPVNRILITISISGFVFLILTVAAIVFFSNRIGDPIQKMILLMQQITQHAAEMILQIGLDRKIVHANKAFEKITGKTVEEVMHREPVLDNLGNVPADVIWRSLAQGTPWSGRVVLRDCKPGPVTLDVMLVPMRDDKGTIQGYLEIGRDITEELKLEKRLLQGQKLEAIGTLAGGIAHDFNNILSAIFGYAELALMERKHDPDTEKYIRRILKASARARDLVSQILTFSRKTEVELRPMQPKTVLKEALKLLRASIPATIDIQSRIESDAAILAEPTQIHQVAMNLFTNAVHAIGDKAGTVRLELMDFIVDEEFIRTHPDVNPGSHVLLRISDTGDGMPPEVREKVFEPFFTTKAQGKGTGLGLSVVHGIVKKLDGTISIYSEKGEGTTFNILFPCTETGQPIQISEDVSLKKGSARVALIDDEPDIASALESILSNLGYRVSAYTDGRKAMETIVSNPGQFDLIITDNTMPQLTGLEIVRRLRDSGIEVPVILTSGYMSKEIEDRARKIGVLEIIAKPVNTYRLADAMHRIVGGDLHNR